MMVESCPSPRIRPKDPNDTSGGFEVQGDKTKFATLQRQRKQLYDELRDTKCRAQVYKKLFFSPTLCWFNEFFFLIFLVLERSSFISFAVWGFIRKITDQRFIWYVSQTLFRWKSRSLLWRRRYLFKFFRTSFTLFNTHTTTLFKKSYHVSYQNSSFTSKVWLKKREITNYNFNESFHKNAIFGLSALFLRPKGQKNIYFCQMTKKLETIFTVPWNIC